MIIRIDDDDENCAHYRCRNLRGGLCSIYDHRPKMCRDFPVDHGKCGHCGFQPPIPIERRVSSISSAFDFPASSG